LSSITLIEYAMQKNLALITSRMEIVYLVIFRKKISVEFFVV
jgi:hypothetical protein